MFSLRLYFYVKMSISSLSNYFLGNRGNGKTIA